MKRKIFAVALSLALLSSLFVFAVPVIADPADPAEHFDVWFELRNGAYQSSDSHREWHGAQATLTLYTDDTMTTTETRTITSGTICQWKPIVQVFDIEGNFGPDIGLQTGTARSVVYFTSNYNTGQGSGHRTLTCDFGDGNTVIFRANGKTTMLYWRYASGSSVRSEAEGSWRIISGTGIFEDLHCNGSLYKYPVEGVDFSGMGHMAPKD